MFRLAAVVFAIVLGAACGSESPVAPKPSPLPEDPVLPVRTGPYIVGLTGFGVSDDPLFPPCVPVEIPRDGTAITTRVSVTRENGEWVARGEAATSDLEIRFQAAPSPPGEYRIAGTARGCAPDQAYGPHSQLDVRLCMGGSGGASLAQLEGRVSYTGRALTARITGAFAFSDHRGATSRCSAIEMFLRPRSLE